MFHADESARDFLRDARDTIGGNCYRSTKRSKLECFRRDCPPLNGSGHEAE